MPNLTPENRAYQLVDSNWPEVKKMTDKFTEMNSPFFQDDSVEGLARKAELPVEAVVAAVDGYNDALKNNKLKELNPPCTRDGSHAMDRGPFYAFPFEGGLWARAQFLPKLVLNPRNHPKPLPRFELGL